MRPELPETHTVDAHDLRKLNMSIDVLGYLRHHRPMDSELADAIDRVLRWWNPIKAQALEQHTKHIGLGEVANVE